MDSLTDLGEGVWLSQAVLWETNAVLALAGVEALLVDPGLTPAEIGRLAAEARRPGGPIHLLVTHADYDHVCGIGAVPEALVAAGASTASLIGDGSAERALAAAGAEWGHEWAGGLRVDRVLDEGPANLGAFRVEAVRADGHTSDGLAYHLVDQGVLVTGDYLSGMTYPFLGGGLAEAIATVRRLVEVVERAALRWVVPGHGAPLSPAEARAVGDGDLAYLCGLEQAVREARERELAPGPALLHVFAVEPPRPTTPDFEIYALRAANARAVLADA